MKKAILIKHSKGAIGLRLFGLGPYLKPNQGLFKLLNLLNNNAFWAKGRTINDLKSDGVYRGVLWDVVIDQNHQGKGYGKLIVQNLLNSKKIKNTKKIYLMTTNQKQFYSQIDFKEVSDQTLLVREIKIKSE